MKPTTEPYDESQKGHGISRMILLSAVLHVVVIGALLVTGYFRSPKPNAPPVTSYEVSLIGPTGTGKRKEASERTSAPPRQAALEKPSIPPAAKGEQQEALLPKPQEKPKPEVQTKPKPQEPPPIEKPQEVAKKIEPPQPKPTTVVKEKEPPKAVAAVKPVEKPPPPEKKIVETKAKEPAKPKVDIRLSEKKEKPTEKPPLQSERVKVQEKKPEVRKTEEKPKVQPTPAKPEKKPQEPVKTTAKEKVSETKKAKNTDAPQKPAVAVPVAKATPSVDATQEREDEEAREKLIASAVERVRTREAAVTRDQDIAKAVNRVRQGIGGQEENGRETEKKSAAANANDEKEKGDGQVAKAKVYGPEFLAYTENIKQRVKESWIVVDRKPGLTAIVRFGVEADGEVIDVELAESSGDRSFDQSALRAVKNAKLPPPPEMYREDFVTQKVHMTFGGEE